MKGALNSDGGILFSSRVKYRYNKYAQSNKLSKILNAMVISRDRLKIFHGINLLLDLRIKKTSSGENSQRNTDGNQMSIVSRKHLLNCGEVVFHDSW